LVNFKIIVAIVFKIFFMLKYIKIVFFFIFLNSIYQNDLKYIYKKLKFFKNTTSELSKRAGKRDHEK